MSAIASSSKGLWPWAAASVAAHGLMLSGLLILLPATVPPGDADVASRDGVEVELLPAATDSAEPTPASMALPVPLAASRPVRADAAAARSIRQAEATTPSVDDPRPERLVDASLNEKDKSNKNNPLNNTINVKHEFIPVHATPAAPKASSTVAHRNTQPGLQDEAARNLAVRQRLERFKHYPASARRRGIEGAVDVRFRLNEHGLAEDMQLISGSGYRILDEAALDTVHRAEPFPVHGGTYRFRLRFTRS